MPAQGIYFSFYLILTVIIFPITVLNFIILNTNLIPNVKLFVVSSDSMSPEMPKGSLVYTFYHNFYNKGDVISFRDKIGMVTHRIVDTISISGNTYFVTKGDANNNIDVELINSENVYGKVNIVVPIFGNLILNFRNLIS